MRKLFALAAAAILGSALLLAGCGSDNTASAGSSGKTTITVGASPVPHAEILE